MNTPSDTINTTIIVDTTAAPITLTLPSTDRLADSSFTIQLASANNPVILTSSTDNICLDDSNAHTVTQTQLDLIDPTRPTYHVFCDSHNWHISG
jgi:hypothetical protein